ncbi:hypothetical protein FRC00_007902 [Tulasnella sp. 408]|nr:hypothetical protein FRC00_007902 [Tulasnella sp. 408]
MPQRRTPGNASNQKIRQNALCCRITFTDTRYEFQLEESHIVALRKGVINDSAVVNFHVASIGNGYAEGWDGPIRPVFVLPSTCFTEWRKTRPRSFKLNVATHYDFFKSTHVVFPFYWESQGRWLLVVLASFGDLLGHEDATATEAAELNFAYIVIDAQHSEAKASYSPLLRPLREFTSAILRLRLDVHHGAIQSAKLVTPQALQPGYYLSLMLSSPDTFIEACNALGFDEDVWEIDQRSEIRRWFQSFVSVHASIGQVNRAWKARRTEEARPTGLAPGDSGEDEVDPAESDVEE